MTEEPFNKNISIHLQIHLRFFLTGTNVLKQFFKRHYFFLWLQFFKPGRQVARFAVDEFLYHLPHFSPGLILRSLWPPCRIAAFALFETFSVFCHRPVFALLFTGRKDNYYLHIISNIVQIYFLCLLCYIEN